MSIATLPSEHQATEHRAPRVASGSTPRLAPGAGTGDSDGQGAKLRLVATPPSPLTHWRRRVTALAGLILVLFLLAAAIGRVGAAADLDDRVAGHVVIEPGETLWEVAARTAADGVDTRAHLNAIQDLNGISGSDVDAWTVVLLPAR